MTDTELKNPLAHDVLMTDIKGYEILAKKLFEHTGIFMDPCEKNYSLMSNRMQKILKKYNCQNYQEFINILNTNNNDAKEDFYQALTTNTTQFFRENEHFIFLKAKMPEIESYLLAEKRKEIRIWCAAASTGEEPYTILMSVLESLNPLNNIAVKITATDINTLVLEKAKLGVYKKELLESVSPALVLKYFERNANTGEEFLQIKEKYRCMIEFSKFNLNAESYLFINKFDIIFCRNVLIYFTHKAVEEVIVKLSRCLDKKGYLFIAHSEAIMGDKLTLKSIAPSVYQLK
ncbi:CheR family methyltransferase [Fluviispira vulneris]|uniref:CheR family methyltransferase n=1 Tax=Fluviispira vulneris TaxID=2763012 RepID=UPI001648E09F|nr:protein-glutamate O-methyltransferase CheR [Fluviispira vulneris]